MRKYFLELKPDEHYDYIWVSTGVENEWTVAYQRSRTELVWKSRNTHIYWLKSDNLNLLTEEELFVELL